MKGDVTDLAEMTGGGRCLLEMYRKLYIFPVTLETNLIYEFPLRSVSLNKLSKKMASLRKPPFILIEENSWSDGNMHIYTHVFV